MLDTHSNKILTIAVLLLATSASGRSGGLSDIFKKMESDGVASRPSALVVSNSVAIRNPFAQPIHFELSSDGDSWSKFTQKPRTNQQYARSKRIRFHDGKNIKTYRLSPTKRYTFSTRNGLLDLSELLPR